MKKFISLTLAIASLLALASCTESDVLNDTIAEELANQPQAVEFGTYMGKVNETRATGGVVGNITTASLQTGAHNVGFGIMAYMKGLNGATDCYTTGTWNAQAPNFMYNQQITYSTDHWTYTPVKFWPNDFAANGNVDNKEGTSETHEAQGSAAAGKLSFFAYAPYVAPADYTTKSDTHQLSSTPNTAFNVDNSGAATDGIVAMTANDYTGEPQVKYILSAADLTHAVDLLWGIRGTATYNKADKTQDTKDLSGGNVYNTDLTKQQVGETVDFLFKHALAKIGGNFYQATPEVKNSGLQIILDLDNGSKDGGVQPGTTITGGVKEDATLVTVSDIKIEDVATYNTRTSVNTFGTTSDLINSGWFNIAKGTWSENTAVGATYSSSVTKTDVIGGGWAMNPSIKEGTVSWDTQWKIDGTARTGVTTTAQNVYTDDSNAPALLLIPSTTQAQTLIITITYTVRTRDTKLTAGWTEVTQTITNEVKFPANSLASNKYYKLLIHLGLTSVKFSATVSDWDSAISGGSGGNDNSSSANDKDIWLPSNTLEVVTP